MVPANSTQPAIISTAPMTVGNIAGPTGCPGIGGKLCVRITTARPRANVSAPETLSLNVMDRRDRGWVLLREADGLHDGAHLLVRGGHQRREFVGLPPADAEAAGRHE